MILVALRYLLFGVRLIVLGTVGSQEGRCGASPSCPHRMRMWTRLEERGGDSLNSSNLTTDVTKVGNGNEKQAR